MLTPLFFGYEATRMAIDPLFLLPDGSWVVGDVQLEIDEQALFRHPELLSLVERRAHAYGDVRLRRQRGLVHTILDDTGPVAVLANGAGLGDLIVDELGARQVSTHSVTAADATAFDGDADKLGYFLEWAAAKNSVRLLLIAVTGDAVDLAACGKALATAIEGRPDVASSIVVRFLGSGAGTAGAALQQAHPDLHLEPMLDAAFDTIAERLSDPPA